MALKACPECKSGVSDKAKKCPKCGSPLTPKSSQVVYVAVAAIVILMSMVFCFGDNLSTQSKTWRSPAKPATRPYLTKEQNMVVDAGCRAFKDGRNNIAFNAFVIATPNTSADATKSLQDAMVGIDWNKPVHAKQLQGMFDSQCKPFTGWQ